MSSAANARHLSANSEGAIDEHQPGCDAPVAIAGGGIAGLCLAIDLALRGVPSIVLEHRELGEDLPVRPHLIGSRSMEHFRRWGVADALRGNDPVSKEISRGISAVTRLNGHLILHRPLPPRRHAGLLPFASEAAQWLPTDFIEMTLWSRLARLPLIDYRSGREVTAFTQDESGVTVTVRGPFGPEIVQADYLAIADGGGSRLRNDMLNVPMEGTQNLGAGFSWRIRAPRLTELWSAGPLASTVYFCNEDRAGDMLVAQGGTDCWQYSTESTPADVDGGNWADVRAMLFRAAGGEFRVGPLSGGAFARHSLVAKRFDFGRVLLVGDAAHQVPPQSLSGMNLAIGDAADLGWKLAALTGGWGGPALLSSYSIDRKERALLIQQHVAASTRAAMTDLVRDGISSDGAAGERIREQVRQDILRNGMAHFPDLEAELGSWYSGSPIVVPDTAAESPPACSETPPSAVPGSRAPHRWLADHTSLYGHFGPGFTLLDLGCADAEPLADAAAIRGVPLQVFTPGETDRAELSAAYQARAVLVRSDQHIVWRGDELPADPGRVIDIVSGNLPTRVPR
jgi:2-polyprenyl-6-methoxyphenol hydroxylase-like FAD-dependent oxidoreductase